MSCTVRASDLFQRAKEILDDGNEFVTIDILPEDRTDPSLPIPACVSFSAFRRRDDFATDYDEIEAADPSK